MAGNLTAHNRTFATHKSCRSVELGSFFCGLIDDIRIYGVALSVERIEALAR